VDQDAGVRPYCCIHLDRSGRVKNYDVVIRPNLREFFANGDPFPLTSHKKLLLDAMGQQAPTEQ